MSYIGQKKKNYNKIWNAKRRKEFFKDKKCIECNPIKNLEFDHIIPRYISKQPKVSWSRSLKWLEKELKNHGQILCKKCHKEKSSTECLNGENNPSAKLTEKDIYAIRKSELSIRILAKIYNVYYTNIGRIKRREIWKHIVP